MEDSEVRKRNVAYKIRIGDILKGKLVLQEGKFGYLELGDKHIVRANIIANCVDKFVQDNEKKYASLTVDDASGQLRLKAFGDDIEVFKEIVQGDTLQIIGNLREWNGDLYMIPEIVKKIDPRWLLVRKLEIQEAKKNIPVTPESPVRDLIMKKVREAEVEGGIEIEAMKLDLQASPKAVDVEITQLLKEGLIYEPRPGKIRYLG